MNKLNEKMEAIKSLDWLIEVIADIGLSIIQIIIASIIIKILTSFIKKSLKLNSKLSDRKRQTLSEVLISVAKYTVWFVAICSILGNFGVNMTSLIAVAGVGSVAIGFGAQSLVQDIITGMFILFEDQFGVGDIITVDRLTGTVESIGLRSTRIRSVDGDLHIIPNGMIKIITNMSKEFNRATIDIGVAYEENIDRVIAVMKDETDKIFKNNLVKGLISEPKVLGIIDLADSAVVIRILADTQIGENWHVEREIRRFMKKRFDKENINIPYPKRVVEIIDNKRKEA
ncbi:mechanosensitive ion channel family protein [[Clostridium] colinum]|uniref:mechanosensitive ion channel family protein n=1 Tax=[Clostridium] colinum TaxID=36835 RepID=UPI0020244AD5|nr:mechanosensitive ion channel family protein [[Clostridium] colinum]